jgi:hypothetical protein
MRQADTYVKTGPSAQLVLQVTPAPLQRALGVVHLRVLGPHLYDLRPSVPLVLHH